LRNDFAGNSFALLSTAQSLVGRNAERKRNELKGGMGANLWGMSVEFYELELEFKLESSKELLCIFLKPRNLAINHLKNHQKL
jgi:hypothetical protein